jgi:hypothetical protein
MPRGPTNLLFIGYLASVPKVKRPWRGIDHPSHLAPKMKKEQSYTSTCPFGLHNLLQAELYFAYTYINTTASLSPLRKIYLSFFSATYLEHCTKIYVLVSVLKL